MVHSHQLRLAAAAGFLFFGAPLALAGPKPTPRPKPSVQQFPADVKARGDRLWNASSPAVKAWANQNATPLAKGTGDPVSAAQTSLHARWPNARGADAANALAFVADYEAAKMLQTDLKSKVDSMSDMSQMDSLRLQMAMDRLSKFMEALSNLLKKLSDTSETIVQNLK